MSEQHKYSWGDTRRYYSQSRYYKNVFGSRLQKVAIDAGFTCPNRDGTLSLKGCYYCNNQSFNPSYCTPKLSVEKQIEVGIKFHQKRYMGVTEYLAYFQAYSNTYAPLKNLKEIYAKALAVPEIKGLIIGTRADCLPENVLDYLAELNLKCHIVVELGVESIHNTTLFNINRCHTIEQTHNAIMALAERNILVGTHFILGLPHETEEQMMEYTDFIAKHPIHSIKLHQLQIIKGTVMAKLFSDNPQIFHQFTAYRYISFLANFIAHLPPEIVIERIMGEVPPNYLSVHGWENLRNEQFIQHFEKYLKEVDIWQGKFHVRK